MSLTASRTLLQTLTGQCRLLSLLVLVIACGCSSKVIEKRVHYDVARVDTIHGVSYPYTFNRALDLRNAGLYEAAAYDYVMLYPDFKDSVVHACLSMDQQLETEDDLNNVAWFLKQSVVGEAMHDPEVWHDGRLDKKVIHNRYEVVDELLYSLLQYGVK